MTGLDVEAARKVLLDSLPRDPKWVAWVDGAVERLAGCVQQQTIDRSALMVLLDVHMLAVAQIDRITGGLEVDPAVTQALKTIAALTDGPRS